MRCKECGGREVIKISKPDNVKFICKNGHKWCEEYTDKGGFHARPESYQTDLEDTLFPSEKVLYNKVLAEIAKNQTFFSASNANEITSHLIDTCKFKKEDVYKLFKKITEFNSGNSAKV